MARSVEGSLHYLFGQVMKATQGRANPAIVWDIMFQRLFPEDYRVFREILENNT